MANQSSTSSTAEMRRHILKAGAAQVDITPPPGIPLTGFLSRLGPSTGIHDCLFARALTLETGGQQVMLITCDLLALDAPFVAAARAAIRDATGVPENNIMIACSHTHSGPATIFLRDCGEVDRPYLDSLRLRLVNAAQDAVSNLHEAKVGAGRGQVDKGVLNRRQPGTPTDPDLDVISFQGEAGKYLAILVNYACHPVCLEATNHLISADYPGYLTRTLQEQTHAVVLFTNGAAGDINPERMGSFAFAEDLGGALATETLRVLDILEYQDTAVLLVTGETLDLPLQLPPTSDEIEQKVFEYQQRLVEAEAAGNVLKGKLHKAMLGWAEATLAGVLRGNVPAYVPAELQVICLGEVMLVGIPGEIFSELGKEIKSSTSMRQVTVLGYTNNDIGYIPARQAYAQGGYEINDAFKFYGYPAVLAPEAGDLVRQSAARLLEWCSSSCP
jgi:neutral ceramidase